MNNKLFISPEPRVGDTLFFRSGETKIRQADGAARGSMRFREVP